MIEPRAYRLCQRSVDLHASPTGLRMKPSQRLLLRWGRHSCLPGKTRHIRQTGMSAPPDRTKTTPGFLPDPATRDGNPDEGLGEAQAGDGSVRCGWDTASATPRSACPCDVFQQQDICPCAGESANGDAGPVYADEHGAKRRLRVEDRQGDARPRAGGAAISRRPASAGRSPGRRRRGRLPARATKLPSCKPSMSSPRRSTIRTPSGRLQRPIR